MFPAAILIRLSIRLLLRPVPLKASVSEGPIDGA